jgi:hypothetical protein
LPRNVHCHRSVGIRNGVDNPAYDENEDAISRFTAITEISEANHAEYLEETATNDGNSNDENTPKRTQIRTNPHINGGTTERKAKKAIKSKKGKKKANKEKKVHLPAPKGWFSDYYYYYYYSRICFADFR